MDNGASSYRRFLAGDERAFDEILHLYRDNLIFFLNRYVHNMTVAEDLAIDAFVDLLVHTHRYHFKTSLKTYLFMVGRSLALNYLKKQSKHPTVPLFEANATDEADLEEKLVAEERKRMVNQALEQLPEEMRLVIHLVYFEELSYEETAKIMKKNKKQVDNLLYRAKQALRPILGREGNL
ncbi:MAG TPA: RNA polymerase subunit sigma-24 [Clostridiales bacterium]|jgi:RNA polymerase sigma-70 factor (ECF subfamily)|nr:RNA polymerase subunit sigma-24 [Clostridiales bacterium]HBE14321.1 RNA polymerase subunit sigma-24 [Clostridiales bacterium]HCG34922.1 RNA polymerase subunit sigma-24 [Clostridiales bacterium]